MAGDRGGSTHSAKPVFNQVNTGNPAGRGGATNSTGIGKVGSYDLGTKPTNTTNKSNKAGQLPDNGPC